MWRTLWTTFLLQGPFFVCEKSSGGALSRVEVLRHIWLRTSTRTQKSSGALRSDDRRASNRFPLSRGRASGARASVPRSCLPVVKKALWGCRPASAVRRPIHLLACEQSEDERPLGLVSVLPLRGGGTPHDPVAARACKRVLRWRFPPFPASLRTGKRVVHATGGARSERGRGKVSSGSNPDGESRGTVFSAPVLAKLWRLSRSKGNFHPPVAAAPTTFQWVGVFRVVRSRARGNIHLQKSWERMRP